MDEPARMVPLMTASTGFEARLLAARLGSEGFLWELRGNVDGPYPVGPVVVLVPAEQVSEARELLIADDVEEAFTAPAFDGAVPGGSLRAREAVLLVLLAVAVVGAVLARSVG